MIIDTSVLIAIANEEKEKSKFLSKMHDAHTTMISCGSLIETFIILRRRFEPDSEEIIHHFLDTLNVKKIPVTEDHVAMAVNAYNTYGKGNHKAKLNFGDCFAYALAKHTGHPLLFKGNDFSYTDITAA